MTKIFRDWTMLVFRVGSDYQTQTFGLRHETTGRTFWECGLLPLCNWNIYSADDLETANKIMEYMGYDHGVGRIEIVPAHKHPTAQHG